MKDTLPLQTEKQILKELKRFIQMNLQSYNHLKQTSLNATSLSIRNALQVAAMKKARLVRDLARVHQNYSRTNEPLDTKLLMPELRKADLQHAAKSIGD